MKIVELLNESKPKSTRDRYWEPNPDRQEKVKKLLGTFKDSNSDQKKAFANSHVDPYELPNGQIVFGNSISNIKDWNSGGAIKVPSRNTDDWFTSAGFAYGSLLSLRTGKTGNVVYWKASAHTPKYE